MDSVRAAAAFTECKYLSIHVELRMIPKLSRCTVDMLSQILYDKTQDVGKTS